jgi:hypothetical protein
MSCRGRIIGGLERRGIVTDLTRHQGLEMLLLGTDELPSKRLGL